jgi:hypothetical protein
MVASQTISRSASLLMATEAPAHLQGRDLTHHLHRLNRPVARLTGDASRDMPFMIESGELGQLMHPHPGDRFLLIPVGLEFLDLSIVGRHGVVAPDTSLDRGHAGHRGPARAIVTEKTIDLKIPSMDLVAEGDGLLDRLVRRALEIEATGTKNDNDDGYEAKTTRRIFHSNPPLFKSASQA